MAGRKGRKTKGWVLENVEELALLVIGALGLAQLVPGMDFGVPFSYAWPVVVMVVALKRLVERNATPKERLK